RGARALGRGGHAADRAAAHDLHRPDDRGDRRAHVLPHLPARRRHSMNALVDTLGAGPPAASASVTADAASGAARSVLSAVAVRIDESSIARAMQEAERCSRPVYEVLAEASGLTGDRYAQALAQAFDYRFIPA